ncbi:MAG: glycosyltransferase [Lachnospiraceae bacterium]|nr:glycosyltransferase [Lachnospiraceae bacterium]
MADIMLSVIVPVYNVRKEYLAECFDSILAQDYPEMELIIVDDGAESGIARFIDDYDYKGMDVHIIHRENGGVASARNAGLDICRGKYVTFIDSDDTIEGDCFLRITEFAEEGSLDVLMFGMYWDYGSRRKEFVSYSRDIPHFTPQQKEEVCYKTLVGILPFYDCPPATTDAAGSACAKLYRVSFLKEKGLRYIPGLKRAEDMEFNFRVFDRATNIGSLHRFYYIYRQVETSASYVYRPDGINVFTASLDAIRSYLIKEGKSDLFMQVYYMRCMFFFLESMDMDYLNPNNPDRLTDRIAKLKQKSAEEPYVEAFENLRTDHLTFARKIPLFLIKHGMFYTLALFYKTYRTVEDHNG